MFALIWAGEAMGAFPFGLGIADGVREFGGVWTEKLAGAGENKFSGFVTTKSRCGPRVRIRLIKRTFSATVWREGEWFVS